MKRYKKFVIEAEKGMTLEVSKETSGELIIRVMSIGSDNVYSKLPTVSAGEYAKVLSMYTDKDGNEAVVPKGWTVSGVPDENIIWGRSWYQGLVIYHIPEEKVSGINWQNPGEVGDLRETYDQFVWTPVGLLTADGTLDGIHFDEKFGRRNYQNDEFGEFGFHEPLDDELLLQKESVDKYDGYYSSRYNISKDEKTGKPRSVMDADPWTNIDFPTVKKVASTMIKSKTVKTHLMYGAEYDTIAKWLIENDAVTIEEIEEDSTQLGNYGDNDEYNHLYRDNRIVVETGEDRNINNLYGFAGNVRKWTQEQHFGSSDHTIRDGAYNVSGEDCPVAYRGSVDSSYSNDSTGFRVTLYIK